MSGNGTRYRAFLLKLWIPDALETKIYASIEDVATGEMRAFSDLELLCEWLRRDTFRDARQRGPSHTNP